MEEKYSKGKISFIVPCYNGEKYIKRFFESLANQTYTNIQLILVNDGSTDNTDFEVKTWKRLLEENSIDFTYLSQKNGGMGKAINKALKFIRGEFFTWFGVDDYPLPTYCEEAITFLNENPEYALVRIDGYYVKENDHSQIEGKVADCNRDKDNPYIFWNAVTETNFPFGYSVLRTLVFENENGGMDIYESYHGQNWQLLLPILYRNKSKTLDKPLYNVIVHQDSVSRITMRNHIKRIAQLKEYIKIILTTIHKMRYISAEDRQKAIEITNHRFARKLYSYALVNGEYNTAQEYYKILKTYKILTKSERAIYRKRFLKIEFWIYVKHIIFNRSK